MDTANDVFISYSRIDEEEEWVGQLVDMLRKRLQQRLGETVKIWRDVGLARNDELEKTLKLELLRSRLLLSIVSSRYVKSEWCRWEVLTYYETARQRGDLMVDSKSRVFKIIKLPPEPDDPPLPAPVQEHFKQVLGYEFFEADPNTRRNREFNGMFGPDWKTKFCLRIDDLADDVNKMLRLMRGKGSAPSKSGLSKTVYLSEAGPDLQSVRDEIRRELRERGFVVLPDQALPTSLPALKQHVEADLARCGSSIHLAGAQSSFTPAGSEPSVDELEYAWAAARGATGPFLRLIWIPRGLQAPGGRRSEFITALREDASAECIEDTTEALEVFMVAKLAALQPRTLTLYLAETTSDLARERALLRERLTSRGVKVLPELELSRVAAHLEAQVREALSVCDGSVHLIGAKYGLIPEDAEQSIVELQARWADAWSREKGRPRFLWACETPSNDPRQTQWVSRLRQEAAGSSKTRWLDGALDQAEAALIEGLKEKPEPVQEPRATAPGMIFLLYDKVDEDRAYALAQLLNEKGFYLPLIDFELDEAARQEALQQHLAECDAALIYWGQSPVSWLNSAISMLRKGALGRQERPLRARAVLMAPPAAVSQRPPLTPPDVMLLRQSGELTTELLNPFIQRLASS